jgi:hypothetical protein
MVFAVVKGEILSLTRKFLEKICFLHILLQLVDGVRTRGYRAYTLTVNGGTGSGMYVAGEIVNITANTAPSGKVFDKLVATAGSLRTKSVTYNCWFSK